MGEFDLVIFDCDGVLVDSEMLSASVLMQQLSEFGIVLSFEDFREDFLGRSFKAATTRLKHRTGRDVPEDFQPEYFKRLLKLFATDLQPMAGVERVLQTLRVQHCVASSSIPPRLTCALNVCNLENYFEERIYSAVLVKNAKPAPDLFLHAAEVNNVNPSRCLVIEDSEMGVLAAQAAGMSVWHFAGGAHIKAGHSLPSDLRVDRVVHDMREMYDIFVTMNICLPTPISH